MKKIFLLMLLLLPVAAFSQTAAFNGYCTLGSTPAITSGMSSSNLNQGLIPQCQVSVFLTGTTNYATIYADLSNTPLTNPFTASTKGQWLFFAAMGHGYDVVMSGGFQPLVYTVPVTLTDLIINSSGGGGGSGCIPSGTSGVFLYDNGSGGCAEGYIDYGVTTPSVLTGTAPFIAFNSTGAPSADRPGVNNFVVSAQDVTIDAYDSSDSTIQLIANGEDGISLCSDPSCGAQPDKPGGGISIKSFTQLSLISVASNIYLQSLNGIFVNDFAGSPGDVVGIAASGQLVPVSPGGGGCSTGGIGTTNGTVTGDNTSTNCGYGNRTPDTASIPANVSTFGSSLLANNSGQNIVAMGTSIGSYAGGSGGVLLGNTEAQGTEVLPCVFTEMVVLIGTDNLSNCGGAVSSANDGVMAVGDQNIQLSTPNTNRLNGVYTFGESNIPSTGSTSASYTVVLGMGYSNLDHLKTSFDLVGIGDSSLSGSTAGSAISDIVAVGDAAGAGIPDGSVDVVALGDGSGDNPGGYSGGGTMADFVAIGDDAVDNATGSDVIGIGDSPISGISSVAVSTGNNLIAIGNHTLVCNTTGSDNIGIGDYAGSIGATRLDCMKANKTGSNNVWIGNNAGPSVTTQLSNTIAIGNSAANTASNQTVIGNPSTVQTIIYGSISVPQTITDPAGATAFSSAQTLTPVGAWTGTPDTTAPIQSILTADFDSATGTIDSGAFASDMEVNGDTQAIDQVYGGLSELSLNGNAPVTIGYGFSTFAGNYGAATVAALTGLDTETENDAAGTVNQRIIHGVAYQKDGGTSTDVWGDSQVVVLQGSGSHMDSVEMIYPRTPEIDAGATIGTLSGVYIGVQKVTGVTTAYAINQLGPADLNYFHGPVQMDNLTGHGTKGPVCADASGNLYIGNNSGSGAPCP